MYTPTGRGASTPRCSAGAFVHLYILDFGHFEMKPGGKLEAAADGRLLRIPRDFCQAIR